MIRLLKALLHDGLSWLLLLGLVVCILLSVTALFNRYDQVDKYKTLLIRLEYDITNLQKEVNRKNEWIVRMESDPTAWEQVARDKMNYLGPNEMLITFVPVRTRPDAATKK